MATTTIILMAKRPLPGRVKTRLVGPLTPEQAAAVHAAMLACILERVAAVLGAEPGTRLVLALDDLTGPAGPRGWERLGQGEGDLGRRMLTLWQKVGSGPAIFLGADSPDVPAAALRSIRPALAAADFAVGPVTDGGYWTLAAARPHPPLLAGIDWGAASVYHDTLAAGRRAGLAPAVLSGWFDVDDATDLQALRRRLGATAAGSDPALRRLATQLDQVCKETF